MPQIRVPATAPEAEKDKAASPRPGAPADSTEGLFRISAEPRDVTIPATGEQATFALRVMNTSAIVDGYAVEAPGAPDLRVF